MNRKNYNLATPEVIATLWEVGAIAHSHLRAGYRMYKVSVPKEGRARVNRLLSGTKINRQGVIYSKDIWNALLAYDERRTSYGHVDDAPKPKAAKAPIMCCGQVKSFRFSDGKIISMCATHSGRTNHYSTEFNSARSIDIKRRNVLCGGAL